MLAPAIGKHHDGGRRGRSGDRDGDVEEPWRDGECVVVQAPELPFGDHHIRLKPREQPHGIAVEQQHLLVLIAEEFALQDGVHHQHAVALLDVVPADEKAHRIGGISQQASVPGYGAIGEEGAHDQRHDNARENVAKLEAPVVPFTAHLARVVAIENLVGMRKVRLVDEMRQQERRQRHQTFVFERHKIQHRQDHERAPAKHEKVDERTKEIFLRGD